jgi:HUS1 checkpoint protein
MRFKAEIQNIRTFTSKICRSSVQAPLITSTEFVASLASLGQYAWVKLSSDDIRFTVIPEQGTQVWA